VSYPRREETKMVTQVHSSTHRELRIREDAVSDVVLGVAGFNMAEFDVCVSISPHLIKLFVLIFNVCLHALNFNVLYFGVRPLRNKGMVSSKSGDKEIDERESIDGDSKRQPATGHKR